MTQIPLIASAEDLPTAIRFGQMNPTSRWFVASRATALKHEEDIPDDWVEKPITAAVSVGGVAVPAVSDAEKKKIDADVADGHEENLPSAIVDPDHDGDDDLVPDKDTDHDGAAYRKSLGLKAAADFAEAVDFESLVASGYYDDYGVDDDYDNYGVDAEMPVTAGLVTITAAFTADQRKDYAKQGIALKDGSFPIPNKRYLGKAIRAVGRAKNNSKSTIKAHIKKRAKALGATYMLPDSYTGVTAAIALQVDERAIAKTLLREKVAPIVAAAAEEREATKAAIRERAGFPKAADGADAVTAAGIIKDVHAGEHAFDEALHPRGKDGKFITEGGRVVADDGAGHRVEGTVEGIHAGLDGKANIQIKTDQGHSIVTTADHVTNAPTAVAHLGEPSAPHANPTTANEHLDNAQFHVDQANKHVDTAMRARSEKTIAKHETASKEHRAAADAELESARNILGAKPRGPIGSKADTDAKLAEDVGGPVTPQLRSDTEKAAEAVRSPATQKLQDNAVERTRRINNATVTKEETKQALRDRVAVGDNSLEARGATKKTDLLGKEAAKQSLRDRVAVGDKSDNPFQRAVDRGDITPTGREHLGGGTHGEAAARLTPGHGTPNPPLDTSKGTARAQQTAGSHQEDVVTQLKRMGYTDRTAKGVRNLTSKDKSTRIKVNSDGSFGLKVNRGDGVYSARNHGVDTSGDAHSVATALHEAGRTAPAVKPHKANVSEDNIMAARKDVIRKGLSDDASATNAHIEAARQRAGSGKA